MATIEEIDELTVEALNGLSSEEEEAPKQKSPSPPASGPPVAVPATATTTVKDEEEDDDDEDLDESLAERLVGLTEMFPECVQNGTVKLVSGSLSAIKGLYSFSRAAAWIIFSTSAVLFAPIIFEVERAQMEEMQKQQQRQILLGPSAAMSGGSHIGHGVGLAPPPPPLH